MADLKTVYMGLELANPVVMASCGLVAAVEGVKKAADAGAGAVVLKSLFEEQIRAETADAAAGVDAFDHPEARAYLQTEEWMRYGPRDYCRLIEGSRKAVSVPVIASVNCISDRWWAEYPKDLESAGADAIELNIQVPGTDPGRSGAVVERMVVDTVAGVAGQVRIPVAAKIGCSYGSLAHVAGEIAEAGAKGLVLFNRFWRPDIDVEKLILKGASPFSDPIEMHLALRWIGILHGTIPCDLAATTGLHEAEHVIKTILAGAAVAQVCSTVYRRGFGQIRAIVDGLGAWMDRKGHASLDEVRGKLSVKTTKDVALYERQQYIKHLVEVH